MRTIKIYASLLIMVLSETTAISQVRLPKLVSNGMILQREAKIKIWGWAAPNEAISINFINVNYQVNANAAGDWEFQLANLNAGGPYTMTLTAGNSITINDVLIGDLWLCSGQSSMAMTVSGVTSYYQNDINNSTNDFIRNFEVPRVYEFTTPRTDLTDGVWVKANPTTVLKFSAAGYFFSKELYEKYQVPVGLIHASYGGTTSIGDSVNTVSYALTRVNITNAIGPLSGSTFTVNPNDNLTLSSSRAAIITLNRENIVNNGTLNITSTSTDASIRITCATPHVASLLTYGYSGSGALNITICDSTTANRFAIECTSLAAKYLSNAFL